MLSDDKMMTDEAVRVSRQIRLRTRLLEFLGLSFIFAALMTDGTMIQALLLSQEPMLPAAPPFLLLIGLLVFVTGLVLGFGVDRRRSS
jgi:hypothetical protein